MGLERYVINITSMVSGRHGDSFSYCLYWSSSRRNGFDIKDVYILTVDSVQWTDPLDHMDLFPWATRAFNFDLSVDELKKPKS